MDIFALYLIEICYISNIYFKVNANQHVSIPFCMVNQLVKSIALKNNKEMDLNEWANDQ